MRRAGLCAVVAAVGVGLYALMPADVADDAAGGAPCLDATGVAIVLLDLRKPLRGDVVSAGALVRDVASRLPPATELRVERISAFPDFPLAPVARLCVPRGTTPTCAERIWTAHAGRREALYCAGLEAVVQEVGELAAAGTPPVASAFVLEAVDESHRALAAARGRRSLHIVSDMLQHAPRHSHVAVRQGRWDAREFAAHRRQQDLGALPPGTAHAEVFYIPRVGVSAADPARAAHQALWRGHLAALGLPATFHDQPAMPSYATRQRRAGPSRFEQLSRQRELLEGDRVARDAARQRLEAASARLAEMRARTASTAPRPARVDDDAAEHRVAAAEG